MNDSINVIKDWPKKQSQFKAKRTQSEANPASLAAEFTLSKVERAGTGLSEFKSLNPAKKSLMQMLTTENELVQSWKRIINRFI